MQCTPVGLDYHPSKLYGNILGINIQLLDKPGNHIVGYICHSNPMSRYGVIMNMLTPKPSQTTINDYKQLESTTIWGISDLRTGHFNRLIKAVFTANAICIGSDGGTTEVIILGAMSLVTLPPGLKREWMNMNEYEWIWFIPPALYPAKKKIFLLFILIWMCTKALSAADESLVGWPRWIFRCLPGCSTMFVGSGDAGYAQLGNSLGLIGQPKWFDLSWFCAAKLVSCQNL